MDKRFLIRKIISGGQTGADQAALDAAIAVGREYGGLVPRGRKTEAGPLPERYALAESDQEGYAHRTEQNVLAAQGTLIVSHGPLTGGSLLTSQLAERHGRPWLHIDLMQVSMAEAVGRVKGWLRARAIQTLNVAGSRASGDPAIYSGVFTLISFLLAERY